MAYAMRISQASVVCSIVWLLVAAAPAVRAAEESEGELIKRGVALREEGKDVEALEVFRRAYDTHKTPRSRAQMGLAAQALGRWLDAETYLEEAVAAAGTDTWIARNRATLDQALEVIRARLGSLEVLCEVPDAEVFVDGQSRGKLPFKRPLRVTAGMVMVHVQAPGYAPIHRHVVVTAGALSRETFRLAPSTSPGDTDEAQPVAIDRRDAPAPYLAASPEPAPEPTKRVHKAVFFAGLAATVIAGGITVWSGLDVLKANDRYEQNPTRAGFDDGRRRENRTNILIGTTAVVGLTTALIGALATDWSR